MEPLTVSSAARQLAAHVIGPDTGVATGVCTDSREGARGALFFALKGENGDGHAYVAAAFRAGAVAAVVDHPVEGVTGTLLVVADTLKALGDLAHYYRQRFYLPVVGVTGSVGKTSTKEMVAHALGGRFRVLVNVRNFNNEIGVPRTVFGLDRSHTAAIIEMGMRGAGQIAELARIAQPTIGLVTNVGVTHIELLGSRDSIAAAKAELLEALPPNGVAVIQADDDYADYLRSRCRTRVATFGLRKPADFRAEDVRFTGQGEPRFRISGQPFEIAAAGVHHVVNAAAACAVASVLGVPLSEVGERLADFRPPPMRMEMMELPDGATVLNDAYNAAPDSMRSALETLEILGRAGRRTVAVLGEMRELGDFALEAHRYVGRFAADRGVEVLVTIGPLAREIAAAGTFREVHSFDDTESAATAIKAIVRSGDIVLVKGSRAMAMEQVVHRLTGGA